MGANPAVVMAVVLMLSWAAASPVAAAPTTERVSVSSAEAEVRGGGYGYGAEISQTGRYVVFPSWAGLLAPFNGPGIDLFIRDRRLGTTRTVPDSSRGQLEWISANARHIAFSRFSPGLMPGEPGGSDLFLSDMRLGTTTRLAPPSGPPGGDFSLSADRQIVAFVSNSPAWAAGDTNGKSDVFVHDRGSGTTRLISSAVDGGPANGWSYPVVLDASGRHVAFWSDATNLVRGDRNRSADLFVHDRVRGTTVRASVSSSGKEVTVVPRGFVDRRVSISADGRRVVFTSKADNLVPGDTNQRYDVFVHHLRSGRTTRVSVTSTGEQVCENRSQPFSFCNRSGDISADGQRVVFYSEAPDLVPGDRNGATDVFLHDLTTRRTMRVSVDSAGGEVCGRRNWEICNLEPKISGNGRYVMFESTAEDLVPNDTNGRRDVFLRGPL